MVRGEKLRHQFYYFVLYFFSRFSPTSLHFVVYGNLSVHVTRDSLGMAQHKNLHCIPLARNLYFAPWRHDGWGDSLQGEIGGIVLDMTVHFATPPSLPPASRQPAVASWPNFSCDCK